MKSNHTNLNRAIPGHVKPLLPILGWTCHHYRGSLTTKLYRLLVFKRCPSDPQNSLESDVIRQRYSILFVFVLIPLALFSALYVKWSSTMSLTTSKWSMFLSGRILFSNKILWIYSKQTEAQLYWLKQGWGHRQITGLDHLLTRLESISRGWVLLIMKRGLSRKSRFFFFSINLFILFLAALGLRCCALAFLWLRTAGATLRCSARASHRGGFSCCGARALGTQALVVVVRGLSSCGSQALEHRLSSCGAQA